MVRRSNGTDKEVRFTGRSSGIDIEAECTHTSNTSILREYHDEDRYLISPEPVMPTPAIADTPVPPTPRDGGRDESVPLEVSGAAGKDPCEAEPAPPRLAKRLLLLLTPNKANEYVLGDLEETFKQYREAEGAWFAYLWYWEQVLLSAWPLIRMVVRGSVRLGLAALLGSWVGKWIDLTKLGTWLRRLLEEWIGRITR